MAKNFASARLRFDGKPIQQIPTPDLAGAAREALQPIVESLQEEIREDLADAGLMERTQVTKLQGGIRVELRDEKEIRRKEYGDRKNPGDMKFAKFLAEHPANAILRERTSKFERDFRKRLGQK